MSRPLRVEYPDAWYHVLQKAARVPLFSGTADYRYFLRLLARTARAMQARMVAYALLPHCYHLVLQTGLANLGAVMRQVNADYSRRCRDNGEEERVLEGRYKAALIEPEGYLAQVVRHVHRAPVEEGEAGGLNFPWSSYRAYLPGRAEPDWLDTQCVLDHFPGEAAAKRKTCKRFMAQEETRQFKALYARGRLPTILGSDDFIAANRRLLRHKTPRASSTARVDVHHAVQDAVCRVFKVTPESLRQVKRGKSNPAREAFMFVLRRKAGLPVTAIADLTGATAHSSVSSTVRRFAEKMQKDESLRIRVAAVQDVLDTIADADKEQGE